MATDIVREIDSNFGIPDGLKNATPKVTVEDVLPTNDVEVDIQTESLDGELSELDEESSEGEVVPAPDYIEVISQTVRTAPDGRQVVDVIIDVEEVENAVKYDIRITKA